MKKKGLILLAVLTMMLGFTACGGTEIVEEDSSVDTKLVAEIDGVELERDNENVLKTMSETDAQFFYAEWQNLNSSESIGPLNIYQTNMATANEIVGNGADSSKASKSVTKQLSDYFGYEFESITEGKQSGSVDYPSYNTAVHFVKGGNNATVYDYYKDNEINLSSENWEVKKFGVLLQYVNEEDNQKGYQYYLICEGDVTTQAKSSDPLELFPEVGESSHITVKISAFGTDADKECGIEDIFFD